MVVVVVSVVTGVVVGFGVVLVVAVVDGGSLVVGALVVASGVVVTAGVVVSSSVVLDSGVVVSTEELCSLVLALSGGGVVASVSGAFPPVLSLLLGSARAAAAPEANDEPRFSAVSCRNDDPRTFFVRRGAESFRTDATIA